MRSFGRNPTLLMVVKIGSVFLKIFLFFDPTLTILGIYPEGRKSEMTDFHIHK